MKYVSLLCLLFFSSCASHKEVQQKAYVITQQLEPLEDKEEQQTSEAVLKP